MEQTIIVTEPADQDFLAGQAITSRALKAKSIQFALIITTALTALVFAVFV
jgi:hypothetical protein